MLVNLKKLDCIWPHKQWLEITTVVGCRVNCTYCPQSLLLRSYPKKATRSLTMETFSRCISTIPDHTEIHFSGYSEPFLNSGCAEMIEHASVHHKVRIFTTLVGSKEDDIKDLSKNPRLSFSIHFPSYPPQENITISERYIKCLKYLLNGKTSVSLHFRGGVLHPSLKELGLNAQQGVLHDRAGNVALNANHKKSPDRNFTNSCDVYCLRLRRNVLLPNGDVSLCCM